MRASDDFTFKPTLNEKSVRIGKSHSVEDLLEWRDGVWRRQAARSVEEFSQEYTFAPKLASRDKHKQREGSVTKRLYMEAKERERSRSRAREELEKAMFKPHINRRSKDLYKKSKEGLTKVKVIETIESTERIDYVHICYGEEESITKRKYKEALTKAKSKGETAKEKSKQRAEKAKKELHERPAFIVNDVIIGGRSEPAQSQRFTSEESMHLSSVKPMLKQEKGSGAKPLGTPDSIYRDEKPTAKKGYINSPPNQFSPELETPKRDVASKAKDRSPIVLSEIIHEQSKQPLPKPLSKSTIKPSAASKPAWPESPSREEIQHKNRFQKMREEFQTNSEAARAKRYEELRLQHKQQKTAPNVPQLDLPDAGEDFYQQDTGDVDSLRYEETNYHKQPNRRTHPSGIRELVQPIEITAEPANEEFESFEENKPLYRIPLLPDQEYGSEYSRGSVRDTPDWVHSSEFDQPQGMRTPSSKAPPRRSAVLPAHNGGRDTAIRSIFTELFQSSVRDANNH